MLSTSTGPASPKRMKRYGDIVQKLSALSASVAGISTTSATIAHPKTCREGRQAPVQKTRWTTKMTLWVMRMTILIPEFPNRTLLPRMKTARPRSSMMIARSSKMWSSMGTVHEGRASSTSSSWQTHMSYQFFSKAIWRIGNPQVGAFLDNKNYVFVCAKSSPSANGFNMIVELLIKKKKIHTTGK